MKNYVLCRFTETQEMLSKGESKEEIAKYFRVTISTLNKVLSDGVARKKALNRVLALKSIDQTNEILLEDLFENGYFIKVSSRLKKLNPKFSNKALKVKHLLVFPPHKLHGEGLCKKTIKDVYCVLKFLELDATEYESYMIKTY